MARSSKKDPYVNKKLLKRVLAQKQFGKKEAIKTWARSCMVAPDFVNHTFAVHNGRIFINVFISEPMVGHRLGEFAPTRTFRGHGKITEKSQAKK